MAGYKCTPMHGFGKRVLVYCFHWRNFTACIAWRTCIDCKKSKYHSHLRHNNIRLSDEIWKHSVGTSSNQSEILACCIVLHVLILLLQWHPSNFFVLGQGPASGSFAWGKQTPVDEAHRTRGWDGGPKFAKAVRVRNRHVLSESHPGVYMSRKILHHHHPTD